MSSNLVSVQSAYEQISSQYQSIVQSLSGPCARPECVGLRDDVADLEAVVAELKVSILTIIQVGFG